VRPWNRVAGKRDKTAERRLAARREALEKRLWHAEWLLRCTNDPAERLKAPREIAVLWMNPWDELLSRWNEVITARQIENEISRLKKMLSGFYEPES
jgi:hypothetical protein